VIIGTVNNNKTTTTTTTTENKQPQQTTTAITSASLWTSAMRQTILQIVALRSDLRRSLSTTVALCCCRDCDVIIIIVIVMVMSFAKSVNNDSKVNKKIFRLRTSLQCSKQEAGAIRYAVQH
jgi:hypothetical protein